MVSTKNNRFPMRPKEAGYLRWKKQLQALYANDMRTVKALGRQAKEELEERRLGIRKLPFNI